MDGVDLALLIDLQLVHLKAVGLNLERVPLLLDQLAAVSHCIGLLKECPARVLRSDYRECR